MRRRLPKDFLKTVKGSEFVPDFYEDGVPFSGKVEKEAVIETVYNNNTIIASIGKIDVIKKGWSDGWMRFRYNDNIVRFYGLQESKRNVLPTQCQLTKQLLQVLGYYSKLNKTSQEDCKVFCLNSAFFYGYVLKSDIEDLIKDTLPYIIESGVSASNLYKKCDNARVIVSNWIGTHLANCHVHLLDTSKEAKNFEINKIFREIYLNCL